MTPILQNPVIPHFAGEREDSRGELNVIKHEGPDNGGCWVVLMDLNV